MEGVRLTAPNARKRSRKVLHSRYQQSPLHPSRERYSPIHTSDRDLKRSERDPENSQRDERQRRQDHLYLLPTSISSLIHPYDAVHTSAARLKVVA